MVKQIITGVVEAPDEWGPREQAPSEHRATAALLQ